MVKTITLLSKNDERAKRISNEAYIFAQKYLTFEAIDDYIIDILLKYS